MKRLIDLLVEAAKELGAESFDISLSAIRKKVVKLDVGSDYKESSYDAELNYHAVNMRSRFSNPPDKNKIGHARWKDEPYFYRVSVGMYRLLLEKDKEIFRLAVQNNLDIVYKDEYDFGILRNIYKNKENIKYYKNGVEYKEKKDIKSPVINIKGSKNLEEELEKLCGLIKERNEVETIIAKIIDRPAIIGHVGEFIASKIFDIELESSAVAKGIDGYFINGRLKGKSVNIKWYAKKENSLDITPKYLPDYYLVMTGPSSPAVSSKGRTRPWLINNVYLFNSKKLVDNLESFKVKIGIATSVRSFLWEEAEIFTVQRNKDLIITGEQIDALGLFG